MIFYSKRLAIALSILLIPLLFAGCKKDDKTLPVPASVKLLIQQYDCTCGPFVDKYTWRHKIVYLYSCNGPNCNCVTFYYDAEGNQFYMHTGYTADDFIAEASRIENVWTCR